MRSGSTQLCFGFFFLGAISETGNELTGNCDRRIAREITTAWEWGTTSNAVQTKWIEHVDKLVLSFATQSWRSDNNEENRAAMMRVCHKSKGKGDKSETLADLPFSVSRMLAAVGFGCIGLGQTVSLTEALQNSLISS